MIKQIEMEKRTASKMQHDTFFRKYAHYLTKSEVLRCHYRDLPHDVGHLGRLGLEPFIEDVLQIILFCKDALHMPALIFYNQAAYIGIIHLKYKK